MSYLGLFAWSFGIAIGPAMSPGPVSAAIVTEGVRRGFRVGPLVATGHALVELLVVGALVLGMGQMLAHPALAAATGVLGGLFLLWMGGTMAWSAAWRQPQLPRPGQSAGIDVGRSLVGLGVATTVGNPFWYVWWIGVGGGYVLMTWEQGWVALVAFYVGHVLADYAWLIVLASAIGSGRRWLNDRLYQALLLVCGLFLIYTGFRFLWAGIDVIL